MRLTLPSIIVTLLATTCLAEPAASQPAEKELPRVAELTDVLRVDLRQRQLDVVLVPPKDFAGVTLKVGRPGEEWTLETADEDRQRDGSFARFALSCQERQGDRWSALHLASVNCDGESISITGVGRVAQTFVSVSYVQEIRSGNGVRLLVQRARRARARPLDDDHAADLVQLFNEHQPQVRQYLLPLFNEMAAANVLRPRPGDVYRAFAQIAPDPAAMKKVRAILPSLDADDAHQRDAASAKLESLGAPAVLAALRIDPSDLTPEQRGRLNAFVERHTLWTDPAGARRDVRFLTDCLEDDDASVRAAALAELRTVARRDIAFDLDASPIARRQAATALLESLTGDDARPAAGE